LGKIVKAKLRPAGYPEFLKKKIPKGGHANRVREILSRLRLITVCENAKCPNLGECFGSQTATFMILGDTCTRNCAFCGVNHGTPKPVEADEPQRIAEAAKLLSLRHVVVTSVTRDDLKDGGASHFAAVVQAVREKTDATVEVLTPDFSGRRESVLTVVKAHPDIFNHNVETVPRLYLQVRPQADYRRSLDLLRTVKEVDNSILTKSGLMVGLGEIFDEVIDLMRDLRGVGCEIITIGQYLRPTPDSLEIARFVTPQEFEQLEKNALKLGFPAAKCGPFVRSSYQAAAVLQNLRTTDKH
jgi:lipoic acid synthetase